MVREEPGAERGSGLWHQPREQCGEMPSPHLQPVHKALDQMHRNCRMCSTRSLGASGRRSGEAILREAQRDTAVLAALRDRPVRATAEPMRAWLAGDYREEPRFPQQQSCDGYAAYSRRLAEIDGEIEEYAAQLKAKMLGRTAAPGEQEAAGSRCIWSGCFRIPGRQPGGQAQKLLGKGGPTPKMVRSAAALAAWLGLCPNHEISGVSCSSVTPRR
jgi:hypothetical protein